MPNESPRERNARQLVEDSRRCEEAARRFRHRIRQGEYAGLGAAAADDLLYVCAVLDSAGRELTDLPAGTRSDVLHLVRRILDDGPKLGDVSPLSAGDGV